MEAKGVNGQMTLGDNEVVISRKGILGFLTQGLKGDKSIDLSHISSIQFKNAGVFTNGYMQLAFVGGSESKAGLWDATSDENTVMFNTSQQKSFEALRDALKQRMQSSRQSPTSGTSAADELEKLAGLRDRGILTEQEFQGKKRQILGL